MSNQGLTVAEANNWLALEPHLLALIAQAVQGMSPAVHVLTSADLADVKVTHAWGGSLGITVHRSPFVRELAPGVRIAAGYSGQGVMLAPWFGKLLADAALGEGAGVNLLARLPTPPFPGGRLLRWPLTVAGLSWYAMRDRI